MKLEETKGMEMSEKNEQKNEESQVSVLEGEPERMTREQRSQFVKDLIGNRIFTSAQLTDMELEHGELFSVFVPLMMVRPTEEYLSQIGVIWEYYDKALLRSVNGKPQFWSMNVMHLDDWKTCLEAYQKRMALLDDLTDL